MYESDKPYAKANEAAMRSAKVLAEMPQQATGAMMAGAACRQSSKSLLLEHAERLRREANQLETLAYAVENVRGDAEATLHRLLSGDFSRR